MDFKDELNRVSRTFDDIIKLENQEQMKLGIEDAELDYNLIKDELIEKARKGKYQIIDGNRRIVLYYNKSRIKGDFNLERSSTRLNKSIFNPKGNYATLMKYWIYEKNGWKRFCNKTKLIFKIVKFLVGNGSFTYLRFVKILVG